MEALRRVEERVRREQHQELLAVLADLKKTLASFDDIRPGDGIMSRDNNEEATEVQSNVVDSFGTPSEQHPLLRAIVETARAISEHRIQHAERTRLGFAVDEEEFVPRIAWDTEEIRPLEETFDLTSPPTLGEALSPVVANSGCYATGDSTDETVSTLFKHLITAEGFEDMDAIRACGQEGRVHYHFAGTVPSFALSSGGDVISSAEVAFFREAFERARRYADPNITLAAEEAAAEELPLCRATIPTELVSSGEDGCHDIEAPLSHYTIFGCITFANFSPEVAKVIFDPSEARGLQAIEYVRVFIVEILSHVYNENQPQILAFDPPLSTIRYLSCEVVLRDLEDLLQNFTTAYEQLEDLPGFLFHTASPTEGLTVMYEVDYRFDRIFFQDTPTDAGYVAANDVLNQTIIAANSGVTGFERAFPEHTEALLMHLRALYPEYYGTILRNTRYGTEVELAIRKRHTFFGLRLLTYVPTTDCNLTTVATSIRTQQAGEDRDRPCDRDPGSCKTIVAIPADYDIAMEQIERDDDLPHLSNTCCPATLDQKIKNRRVLMEAFDPLVWFEEGVFVRGDFQSNVPMTVESSVGNGSQRELTFVGGTSQNSLDFQETLDGAYTIAAILRATTTTATGAGGVRNKLSENWFHGIDGPLLGHVSYGGGLKSELQSDIDPSIILVDDWIVVVARRQQPSNSASADFNVLINGRPRGEGSDGGVGIDVAGPTIDLATTALAELLIYERNLTDVDMSLVSLYLLHKIGIIDASGTYFQNTMLPMCLAPDDESDSDESDSAS